MNALVSGPQIVGCGQRCSQVRRNNLVAVVPHDGAVRQTWPQSPQLVSRYFCLVPDSATHMHGCTYLHAGQMSAVAQGLEIVSKDAQTPRPSIYQDHQHLTTNDCGT